MQIYFFAIATTTKLMIPVLVVQLQSACIRD